MEGPTGAVQKQMAPRVCVCVCVCVYFLKIEAKMPHHIQIHEPCATFRRCRCPCAIKQCQCSMSKMSIMSKKEKKKRKQRQPHGSALLSPPKRTDKGKKRKKGQEHTKTIGPRRKINPTKVLRRQKRTSQEIPQIHTTPVPSTNPKPTMAWSHPNNQANSRLQHRPPKSGL